MDTSEYLFSPAALAVLDSQPYDPEAKGAYEWLSGGLVWEDDFPEVGAPGWDVVFAPWAYRFLIAARAAITLGDEQTGFRPTWEQVLRDAPNWPGLRPERRGEQARKRLLAAKRRADRCLDELEQKFEVQRDNKSEVFAPKGCPLIARGVSPWERRHNHPKPRRGGRTRSDVSPRWGLVIVR